MFVLQSMSSEWPPRAVSLLLVLSFSLVAVVLLLVKSKLLMHPKITKAMMIISKVNEATSEHVDEFTSKQVA